MSTETETERNVDGNRKMRKNQAAVKLQWLHSLVSVFRDEETFFNEFLVGLTYTRFSKVHTICTTFYDLSFSLFLSRRESRGDDA